MKTADSLFFERLIRCLCIFVKVYKNDVNPC